MARSPRNWIGSSASSLLLGLMHVACSADSAPEPAPTLETPGSFVAKRNDAGWLLHRTLSGVHLTPERLLLFFASYPPEHATIEQARSVARGPTPTQAALVITEKDQFMETATELLWFRSLSEEDLELLP